MKLIILFFLSTFTLLTSCNGNTFNQQKNTDQFIKGNNVKELGNNIMVIYQDRKNVYWFGSWETGVYKYDGKELVNYTTKHGLLNNRIDEIKEDDDDLYGNKEWTPYDDDNEYDDYGDYDNSDEDEEN